MTLKRLISMIARLGVEDNVLAVFMLSGPVVIILFTLVGRSVVTIVIAATYVCLFILYIAYKGL